jgi:hypothetical protein
MLSPTTPLVMRFLLAAAVTLPAAAKDACIKA